MLTTQQTTDLSTWLKNQEQPLPESLKDVLIEDCLEYLTDEEGVSNPKRESFNKNSFGWTCFFVPGQREDYSETWSLDTVFFDYGGGGYYFYDLPNSYKISIIQIFLSQIDGKAVLEFLGVKNKGIETLISEYDQTSNVEYNYCLGLLTNTPLTLDHLLYREFTEALRIGKTFDEALEIITKIYLREKYV